MRCRWASCDSKFTDSIICLTHQEEAEWLQLLKETEGAADGPNQDGEASAAGHIDTGSERTGLAHQAEDICTGEQL